MISVIICNVDPVKWLTVTAMYGNLLRDLPHEIVGVHDARSMCDGYQRGMERSTGDVLIFSHDDVEFLAADFGRHLSGHLERYDLIGVAGTTRLSGPRWFDAGPPHIFGQVAHVDPAGSGYLVDIYGAPAPVVTGIQAMDGLFVACRRAAALDVGWDGATFGGWHCYDLDFTFRAHLAGYGLAVGNDLLPVHRSAGDFGDDTWQHDARKFVEKFRGRLAAAPAYAFKWAAVLVPTKAEVVEVMTPPHWGRLNLAASNVPDVDRLLHGALEHHRGGRLAQAEGIYRQILKWDARHADALHLLGVIASQVGRHDAAVELIRQALAVRPNLPEAHSNLGNVLRKLGRLDDAIAACRQAVALRENFPEGYNNLGDALRDQGRLDDAAAAYRQALSLRPDFPEARDNLGALARDGT